MTKEELLKSLQEMALSLKSDKATEVTAQSRRAELKEIEEKRELLNFQIRELEKKLADDSNYPSFTLIKDQSRIFDLRSKIGTVESDIKQNEADVTKNDQSILFINGEIEACTALLSEAQNDLDKYGQELRNLGENPDPEQEQKILKKLNDTREARAWLESQMAIYSADLRELNTTKDNLLKRKENLASMQSRYQTLLDSANEIDEKNSQTQIDTVKKEADERKLLQLRSVVESFDKRENYISFDLPIE